VDFAQWQFDLPTAGTYRVSVSWTTLVAPRDPDAWFRVFDGDESSSTVFDGYVDQRLAPNADVIEDGTAFQDLGMFAITQPQLTVRLQEDTVGPSEGFMIADAVRIELLKPLQVDPQSAVSPASPSVAETLTSAALAPIVEEAIQRWSAVQPSAETELTGVGVRIEDLPDEDLGLSSQQVVMIDADAAGYGWFIDPTPGDDDEFDATGAAIEEQAVGRFDLLTVVMHEFGHVLGLDDLESPIAGDALMSETLPLGTRRTQRFDDQSLSVAENIAPGTTVGDVSARDPNAGTMLAYAITAGNDAGLFAINAQTGAITVAGGLDHEAAASHSLTVRVTDGQLSETATMTVSVTDVNEPPLVSDHSSLLLAENIAPGTSVGSVAASDPDAGTTLSYTITAGNDGGLFAINATSGAITVAGGLDHEPAASRSLTVRVSDGQFSSAGNITILVSAGPSHLTNPNNSFDVDTSGSVDFRDILAIVAGLRSNGAYDVPAESSVYLPPYSDANADLHVNFRDILALIAFLRNSRAPEGEADRAVAEPDSAIENSPFELYSTSALPTTPTSVAADPTGLRGAVEPANQAFAQLAAKHEAGESIASLLASIPQNVPQRLQVLAQVPSGATSFSERVEIGWFVSPPGSLQTLSGSELFYLQDLATSISNTSSLVDKPLVSVDQGHELKQKSNSNQRPVNLLYEDFEGQIQNKSRTSIANELERDEGAKTLLNRKEAIKKALESGVPLSQIEQHFDWLSAFGEDDAKENIEAAVFDSPTAVDTVLLAVEEELRNESPSTEDPADALFDHLEHESRYDHYKAAVDEIMTDWQATKPRQRKEVLKKALDLGVPLNQIEEHLDWLGAVSHNEHRGNGGESEET